MIDGFALFSQQIPQHGAKEEIHRFILVTFLSISCRFFWALPGHRGSLYSGVAIYLHLVCEGT